MAIYKYSTKAGARYQARFKHQGQVYRQAGFRLKAEAKAWIADEKRRLKKVKPTSGGFSDLSEAYLNDKEGKLQPSTLNQKSFVFSKFIALHTDLPIEDITRSHIKAYIVEQNKDRGPIAANRDLRDLHALFSWAMTEGKITNNPASNIEKYPEENKTRYVPSPKDVAAVLLKANREQIDLLEAYLNTACRMSEIFNLTKDRVDLDRNVIHVWTRKRKGGEKAWRSIAINKTLRSVIVRRMKESKSELVFENPRTGGPYSRNQHTIKYLLTRLCEAANVQRFTLHALRHFASTKAAAAYERGEISLRELQKLLGHERLSTTEIYIESLQTDTRRVTDILDRAEGEIHRPLS